MVKCEYCGNVYYNNEKYCESCGAALTKVNDPINSTMSEKPRVVNTNPTVQKQFSQSKSTNKTNVTVQFIVGIIISTVILANIVIMFSSTLDDGDDYIYTDNSDYVVVPEYKYTSADYGLYNDFNTRFKGNPVDTEAVEYLIWYYLDKEQPSEAYKVMDTFFEQEFDTDGQIYIDMANVFIGFELYGNAYMILDRGYQLTKLESISMYNDGINLMNNFKDTQMGDILVMMFHKDLDLITYKDLAQIKSIKINEDGKVISYSKVEPEVVDGYVKDFESYESNMETITLAEYLYEETNFDVFPDLKVYIDDRRIYDLSIFPYYYNLRYLSVVSGSSDMPIEKIPTMPKLQGLSLYGGNFGAINNIDTLESLELLQLSYTDVSNLSKLKELKNLKTILMNDNKSIISTGDIAEISTLKHLEIEDMELVAIELNPDIVKLETLVIVDTEVRNVDFIGKCTELTSLEMHSNRELASMPKLNGLTKLESLTVETVKDSKGNNSVDFVRGITSLKYLYVDGGVRNVEPIGTLTNLEQLTIYGDFGFLDSNMSELGALTKLQKFSLTGRSYEDFIDLSFLNKTKNVTQLNLSGAERVRGDAIFNLPNLKELHISSFIGDFSGITKLKNLEILSLNSVTIMKDIDVEYYGGITYVDYVGESELSDFAGSLKQLTSLKELRVCSNDLTSVEFGRNLTNLECFVIDDNYVTDLEPISYLNNLKYLSVVENPISNWSGLKEKNDLEIVMVYPNN